MKITKEQKIEGTREILPGDVEAFQKIVKLLTDFDEMADKMNKSQRKQTVGHALRKIIATAPHDCVRFFVQKFEGHFVYMVSAEWKENINVGSDSLKTSWLHDDGIRQERESAGKDHPVHNIVCISDLYDRGYPGRTAGN